jgi:beta-lactamase class A
MMRTLALLLLCAAVPLSAAAQTTPANARVDRDLQRQLEEVVRGFDGKVGIYVRNLKTNRVAMIDADSAFPTASMIKVPILVATFDAIAQGRLTYTQQLIYTDSLAYVDEDELGYQLKDSAKVRLS